MADQIAILRVLPFSQELRPDSATLEEDWIPFFAGLEAPLRIISRTERFDLRGPQQGLDQQLRPLLERAGSLTPLVQVVVDPNLDDMQCLERLAAVWPELPTALQHDLRTHLGDAPTRAQWLAVLQELGRPLWRQRWLQEYWQMYDLLMHQISLRGLHHYVVAWLPAGVRPEDEAAIVGRSFDTIAHLSHLPAVLPGVYDEREDHLAPTDPQLPLIAMLISHDFKGAWDSTTLHRLLALDMDLSLCIDVGVVSRTKAELQVEFAVTSLSNDLQTGQGPRDVKKERKLQAAISAQEVLDTQALHDLRLIVAVQGRDLPTLRQNLREVQTAGGARLKLTLPKYGQAPLVPFFGTTPTAKIMALTCPRRMPSHGVAVTVPFGLRRADRTDGILWLLQGNTPIMFNPVANKRAGHTIVLGKTGSGKTFAFNVWAMRMLTLGWQVVLFEPQGHSRRLVQAASQGGARYVLDLNQCVNVLDVIATRDEQGRPPALGEQIAHVIAQLGVLLGRSEITAEGRVRFQARAWTNLERGFLDLALQALYAPWADNLDQVMPDQTPIVSDLCAALRALPEPEAQALEREITLRLVRSSLRDTFNARTSIDWDFTHDVTAYDFSAIPDGELRIFYYGQAFGALNRYVRSVVRARGRPIIAAIDEFKYMATVPFLATWAAMASKTWRTFGGVLVTMDQDAHTYLGTEHGTPDEATLSIFLNSTTKVIFRQDKADAGRLGTKIEGLTAAHVTAITRLKQGECVLVFESDDAHHRHNEVFLGSVVPTAAELRAFAGT